MITDNELAELERLCEAATAGPWDTRHGCIVAVADRELICGINPNTESAKFIIAARVALPKLIAEVKRLRAELAQADAGELGGHARRFGGSGLILRRGRNRRRQRDLDRSGVPTDSLNRRQGPAIGIGQERG